MLLPKRVTIELTNRCNRACQGCPRHKMNYPLGDMSLHLLDKIVAQLPTTTIMVPFFRGETLLHPCFADAMEKLKKFSDVQLATNGDYLNKKRLDAIVSTCSFLSMSLHQFQYPNKQVKFLHAANKHGLSTQVSILETLIPYGLKKKFIESWLKHVDRVRIYVEHSHKGLGDVRRKPKITENLPCKRPFEQMVVYWDGKVGLCNHDWNNGVNLGDLNKESVEQVWNGAIYEIVREAHNHGRRKLIESCQDCDYWITSYLPNKMFGELYTN